MTRSVCTLAWLPAVLALAGLASCDELAGPEARPTPHRGELGALAVRLALDTVAVGLDRPLFATAAPGYPNYLFVVEKTGRIRVLSNGNLLTHPFLDISAGVSGGNEQGLLGLAFHPDYATNRRFFVNYTNLSGDTRVAEYLRSIDTATRADRATRRVILAVNQPAANHNGGMMAFGRDGYLYIALGDGGGGNHQNGQRTNTLLGKILRIDVDHGERYAIPPDNPFVGMTGVRPEIWHLGLRNPWRFSFDRRRGAMYIGDVGQNAYEEVNVAAAGRGGINFGWSTMEGRSCWPTGPCDRTGLRRPVHLYTHDVGCSITGGYVYRGAAMPDLQGTYFFADFCSGVLSSFRLVSGQVTELRDWTADVGTLGNVTSFGEDAAGELYVTTLGGGLYKLVPRP